MERNAPFQPKVQDFLICWTAAVHCEVHPQQYASFKISDSSLDHYELRRWRGEVLRPLHGDFGDVLITFLIKLHNLNAFLQ